MRIKSKIENLRNEIEKANQEYYVLNRPSMSDYKYDELMNELIELEKKYPKYRKSSSPTNKVGALPKNKFSKVKHKKSMLSLSNVFNLDDLYAYFKNIQTNKDISYITEMKIDGLAISLVYKKGNLIQAATRGNGIVGEDVTENIKVITSIPKTLKKPVNIEVRGEVFMSKKAFKKLNEQRQNNKDELFANPRNAAAGSLRQLDVEVVKRRNLDAFFYSIVDPEKHVSTQAEAIEYISSLGLKVNNNFKVKKNLEQIADEITKYEKIREELDFEIDGIVVKVNEFNTYRSIGYTSKYPKWATAYKFQPEKGTTKVIDIIFQIGRTGVLTPVAVLEPIFLSGSKISRATLHNEDFIRNKDIRINDDVIIHKAGEIIPEVIEVDKTKRKDQKTFKMIQNCPVCGSKLSKKKEEVDYFCLNTNCEARKINSIIHFCNRSAMNIEFLGQKVIKDLFGLGYLKDITDLYNLSKFKKELINLPGFGEKKVDNILNSIEKSKNQTPDKVLFGLGIKNVGLTVSKNLINTFESINSLAQANKNRIMEVYDIGEEIADSIIHYFSEDKNKKILEKLEQNQIKLKKDIIKYKKHRFNDKYFVITGKFELYSRMEMIKIIESLGGKVQTAISSKTDFLVFGENVGSKMKKAQNYEIELINESQFKETINEK